MNEKQPIPDRVFKVIGDLLQRTPDKCSPGEAEQAAEKVQELLLKYNLSLGDVEARKEKGTKRFNKTFFDLNGRQGVHDSDWVCSLSSVLAKHNLCQAIHIPPMRKMVILGEPHNVDVVLYLCDFLVRQIQSACSGAWAIYKGHEKRGTFRRGFLSGCVYGIQVKLQEQAEQMAARDNNLLGLIKVNSTDLQKYVDEVFGQDALEKPDERQGKLRKSSDSHLLGYIAGKKMGIHKPIEDKKDPTGYLD